MRYELHTGDMKIVSTNIKILWRLCHKYKEFVIYQFFSSKLSQTTMYPALTAADVEKINNFTKDGVLFHDMAKHFGMSWWALKQRMNVIETKCGQLGIASPFIQRGKPMSRLDCIDAIELIDNGIRRDEIADQYGICLSHFNKIIRNYKKQTMKSITALLFLIFISFSAANAQKTGSSSISPKRSLSITLTIQSWQDLLQSYNIAVGLCQNNDATTIGQLKIIRQGEPIMQDSIIYQLRNQLAAKSPVADSAKKNK